MERWIQSGRSKCQIPKYWFFSIFGLSIRKEDAKWRFVDSPNSAGQQDAAILGSWLDIGDTLRRIANVREPRIVWVEVGRMRLTLRFPSPPSAVTAYSETKTGASIPAFTLSNWFTLLNLHEGHHPIKLRLEGIHWGKISGKLHGTMGCYAIQSIMIVFSPENV